jgi:tRNA U34 5-carboxymethylaminomethyl modifying GTPase MnmE/TrmE
MSDSSPGKLPGSISSDVSAWLRELSALLGQVQVALEHVQPREGTSADVRELIDQLPAQIRQCRSQVPCEEMIRTWVRVSIEKDRPALQMAG